MTDDDTPTAESRCGPVWPKDALRIAFGTIWLIDAVLKWLPGFRSNYMSTIMGSRDGQPAWLVEFRQRPDRPSRTFGFRTLKGYYSLPLQGRAWIAADSGEILHLETGMMHALPAINMFGLYLSITYAPVRFQSRDVRVWLPQLADVYYDYGELEAIVHHTFSDFLLFSVDTDQTITKPKSPNPNP